MGSDYVSLDISFDMDKGEFDVYSDMKREKQYDIIESFLRGQIGKGADNREPNRKSVYHIKIKWYPDDDVFEAESDTGNRGLRDGILIYILNKWDSLKD